MNERVDLANELIVDLFQAMMGNSVLAHLFVPEDILPDIPAKRNLKLVLEKLSHVELISYSASSSGLHTHYLHSGYLGSY